MASARVSGNGTASSSVWTYALASLFVLHLCFPRSAYAQSSGTTTVDPVHAFIGVIISLTASCIDAIGINLQRRDHVQNAMRSPEQQRHECKRLTWHVGFYMYIGSQLFGSSLALCKCLSSSGHCFGDSDDRLTHVVHRFLAPRRSGPARFSVVGL
jgi:hypothetical protein